MHRMNICSWVVPALLMVGLGPGSAIVAAAAEDAAAILRESGVRGGLVVHVGCGDGQLTAGLRANDGYLVHGLDADPARVEKARAYLQTTGLYGKVSVDRLSGHTLPYSESLVNLVVSEDLGPVPLTEVMRVLAPGGVAYVRSQGEWSKTIKPRPPEIDEWTHSLYGPENNAVGRDAVVGPPVHMQWLSGPKWSRSHEHLSSFSAAVSAGGRLFYIVDLGPLASVVLPPQWFLIVRDAFNGVILWQRPLNSWEDHMLGSRAGPSQLPRRLVAVNDRVYVTLGFGEPVSALEAATGETVREYAGTEGTREILYDEGRLYLVTGEVITAEKEAAAAAARRRGINPASSASSEILVLSAESGEMLWRKADADTKRLRAGTLAVSGDRVYYMQANEVLCLDGESGESQWRAARPVVAKPADAATLVVYDDVVLTADLAVKPPPQGDEHRSEVIAFSAATGEKLWSHESGELYVSPTNVLVANGMVWSGRMWSVVDPGITEAWDPRTGEVRLRKPPETPEMLGMSHHRCYRDRATERYLVLGRVGVEFLDTQSGEMNFNHFVRGECQFGILPCNGLLYVTPHPCACYVEALFAGLGPRAAASGRTDHAAGAGGRAARTRARLFRECSQSSTGCESWGLADLPSRCCAKRNHTLGGSGNGAPCLASGSGRTPERSGSGRREVVCFLRRHAYRDGP